MSFYKRYELDRLIADGDAKTFRAIDNQTGRAVLLHMFNPMGAPVLAALKAKLGGDPRNLRPPLLELGEFAGSPYAVTEVVAGFTNLREWIATFSGEPILPRKLSTTEQFHSLFEDTKPPVPSPPPHALPPRQAGPPPQASLPQQATPAQVTPQMVPPSPIVASPPQAPTSPQAAPPPVARPPMAPAVQPDAGEFTRMFGGSSAPVRPEPKPAAPANEPGEFTRIFGGSAPPARLEPKPVAPAGDSGEFTRNFGGGQSAAAPVAPPGQIASPGPILSAPPGPIAPPSLPPPPSAPSTRTDTGQGEFTRWFKLEPDAVKSPKPPPPKPPGDDFERMFGPMPTSAPEPIESRDRGEHTALFGMGQHGESINIEEEQARAARSAAPEAKPFQAPSEFTRMFGPEEGAARVLPPTQPKGPRTTSASGLFGPPTHLGGKATERSRTQTGPGEYTRLIATPQKKDLANQAGQVAPAPPPKKNWLLILGIGIPVLALVAIAIVAILRNR